MPKYAVVLLAAGSSARFNRGTNSAAKKEYSLIDGIPLVRYSLRLFIEQSDCAAIVLVIPENGETEAKHAVGEALLRQAAGTLLFCAGGTQRADSVKNGLAALHAMQPDYVVIHDAARPFVHPELLQRVVEAAFQHGAAVPVVPLTDTVKSVDEHGFVYKHLQRSALRAVQTPQAYRYPELCSAYAAWKGESGADISDDSMLWPGTVCTVPGDRHNIKITYREDTEKFMHSVRVGHGNDIHRLVSGRPLILGGCSVPAERGEAAHSDGDVLYHALTDALLGSIAAGDIGRHFPPSDDAWKNAPSNLFVEKALSLVEMAGWRLVNVDATIQLEKPKLAPHIDAIRASVAACLHLDVGAVSIKAKTNEGLGAIGRGEAVAAQALVVIRKKS